MVDLERQQMERNLRHTANHKDQCPAMKICMCRDRWRISGAIVSNEISFSKVSKTGDYSESEKDFTVTEQRAST